MAVLTGSEVVGALVIADVVVDLDVNWALRNV